MKQIPKISLPVERLLTQAETYQDLVTYSSEIKGAGYIADGEGVLLITTRRGYLRLQEEDIEKLATELQYIAEEIRRRRR